MHYRTKLTNFEYVHVQIFVTQLGDHTGKVPCVDRKSQSTFVVSVE